MAEERAHRRLAAILAADVVGYSRLMERDEAGTLSMLKSRRAEILQPAVSKHHGRIVKVMGDGVLVEFASAVNAVTCAVELQKKMGEAGAGQPEDTRIVLRVGVSLGDVIVDGSDIYGDGVNIAARLEALADPGEVFVSQTVVSQVRGKVQLGFDDLGEQTLKNLVEPVRVYRISGAINSDSRATSDKPALTSKLSIAVLPFVNLSGEPEQEYFSDGITEDIITDLSKVSTLNVLSRNTTFTFKGKAVDISQIARQLRVGHVVEGSVRKAGGRVRITAQLIDASKDSHVWAERYDRDLSDIFALQDEISQAIVGALKVKLLPEERKAIERRSTDNPQAYEYYLLARYYQTQFGERTLKIALRFCNRALEIDPKFARAWALAAICEASLYARGKSKDSGLSSAETALSLDSKLGEAYAAKGLALYHLGRRADALVAHQESLRLEPDSYDVRAAFGLTCMRTGNLKAATEHYERGSQLLEADYMCLSMLASCLHALGRYDECKAVARRSLIRIEREIAVRPDNTHAISHGAGDLIYLGEKERAKEWILRALIIDPDETTILYNLACALSQLGEIDHALDLLDRHIDVMAPERIDWIKLDGDLTQLHHHPRYKAIIERGEAGGG